MDYFLEMESKIKEEIGKWKEGAFTVPRDLYYNKEEALCKSIERAIWVSRHLPHSLCIVLIQKFDL